MKNISKQTVPFLNIVNYRIKEGLKVSIFIFYEEKIRLTF